MLSRVADSLYWMSRNIERSENNARTLSSQLIYMLEDSEQHILDSSWEVILEICASKGEYDNHYSRLNSESIIQFFTQSRENKDSLINLLGSAREHARASRTIIPDSVWQLLNRFYIEKKDQLEQPLNSSNIHSELYDIVDMSTNFQGIIESAMLRGKPYSFVKIGKWIERADTTARTLKVICEKTLKENTGLQVSDHLLHALQVVNGYDSFIMEHQLTLEPNEVFTFLIEEERFPRSIKYCLGHTLNAVEQLNSGKRPQYTEELLQLLANTQRGIKRSEVSEMTIEELLVFLNGFQEHCERINEVFSATYNLDGYKKRTVLKE
ncbi:alpha-E domain-containing protein [Halobacillus massiliensis]|uniref:alpha-E domain-containing protein n=1 Tax=Halobacillus massiliensis TaxID=1926286 RepID=UPI0015C46414|nr:alpha-E domain-containing protein [Halobacillus massiliensis]